MTPSAALPESSPAAVEPPVAPTEPTIPVEPPVALVPPAAVPAPPAPPAVEGEDEEIVFPEEPPAEEAAPAPEKPSIEAAPIEKTDAVLADLSEEEKAQVSALSPKAAAALEAIGLRTSRGRRQLEAFKIRQELERAPEEGGLGRMPTIEEIREGESARMQMMAMEHEFVANPQSWARNFFAPDPQTGQLREGAREMLATLPRILPSDLYKPMAYEFLNPYVEFLYKTAFEMPESVAGPDGKPIANEARQRVLDTAQISEYYITGKARQISADAAPVQPPRGALDPEKEALRQQVAQSRQREQSYLQAQIRSFDEGVAGQIERYVAADVDAALSRITAVYPKDSVAYRAIRDQLVSETVDRVGGNPQSGISAFNPTQYETYRIQLDQARRSYLRGDPSPSRAAIGTYRKIAQGVIQKIAPSYLKDAAAAVKATVDAAHRAQAPAQGRGEPASTGASSILSPAPPAPPAWDKTKGWADNAASQLAAAMMGTATR